MKLWGLEWSALDSYFQFVEQSASPATPESNHIRLYAKDSSGTSTLCYKNDAGTEVCLPTAGPFVTGAGVVNRLAYWTSGSVIDDVPRTFTAGSVLFTHSDFLPQEDNANFFWDDTNNLLTLGTAGGVHGVASNTRLALDRDDICTLDIAAHGSNAASIFPFLDFYRSGGTHAAPTILAADNFVGSIRAKCYDGNSYENVARISFMTGSTAPADGATPGSIYFLVTPVGSVTPTERFRMGQAGEFGIGGANFGTSGQVFTSGGAAAAPSWATPITDHGALTGLLDDDHTQYRLESADHSHQSTGLQAGQLDHGLAITGLTDDDHTQYALLAGRAGGQILIGGTAAGNQLILEASSNTSAAAFMGFRASRAAAFTPNVSFEFDSSNAKI